MTFEDDMKKRHRRGKRLMVAGVIIFVTSWAFCPPRHGNSGTSYDFETQMWEHKERNYEGRFYAGFAMAGGGLVFMLGQFYRIDR